MKVVNYIGKFFFLDFFSLDKESRFVYCVAPSEQEILKHQKPLQLGNRLDILVSIC